MFNARCFVAFPVLAICIASAHAHDLQSLMHLTTESKVKTASDALDSYIASLVNDEDFKEGQSRNISFIQLSREFMTMQFYGMLDFRCRKPCLCLVAIYSRIISMYSLRLSPVTRFKQVDGFTHCYMMNTGARKP